MAEVGAAVREANPVAEPRVGLLAAARVVADAQLRWGMGIEWMPELHPDTSEAHGARALNCAMSDVLAAAGADDKPTVEEAYPFQVYAFDWCSTLEERDWRGRAQRLLQATRSFNIAREFWAGTIAQANGWTTNTWLGSATSLVTAAAVAPGKALAKLDAGVAAALRNGRGMIHCTVETLGRLVQDDAVMRDGNQWVTPFGNLVVADAGYTGDRDGQAANTEWMVGTSMVEIILGAVNVIDPSSDEGLRMAVHHTVNDMKVLAVQDVIVVHEPSICLKAAQVDLS